MAKRRMFSRDITDSDPFTSLPLSAQALYFHVCMDADDDGFCSAPKRVQRSIGASNDDLDILLERRFLLPFPSGIVAVKHWRINNAIAPSKRRPTVYTEELAALNVKENGAYTERSENAAERLQDGCKPAAQYRVGEDRTGEDSSGEGSAPPTIEAVALYVSEQRYSFDPARFHAYYTARGWKSHGEPIEDWTALADYWQTTESATDDGEEWANEYAS